MTEKRATDEELAQEARRWDSGEVTPAGWEDAPEAVPRAGESVAISLRMPRRMVEILKEFARRSGVGYQVLIKRWLDDRIRQERDRLREEAARRQVTVRIVQPTFDRRAASFDARGVGVLSDAAGGVKTEDTPKAATG
jgi:hypothetical protein